MGGVLGLVFCERHPQLVSTLVDVDGNKSPEDCVFSNRASSQSLASFLEEGFDELKDLVFEKGKSDPAHRGYYVSLRLCDPRCYHLNSTELLQMSQREDLAQRLFALPLPARYVAGVPRGVCRHSLELLSQAGVRWKPVEPAGHWPFIDQPDQFVKTLNWALTAAA
jgi:pimeloyl-ACP methyl ester carboxylesterase